ncbi:MAG TPA: hypothetical protein VFT46_12835 [Holophagaceae bacterium]|nr:hypothetical protein [Holophagaceae bacterium]
MPEPRDSQAPAPVPADDPHAHRLRRLEHLALALLNEAASGSSPGLLDPDIDLLLDRMETLAERLRASRGGP